MYIEYKGLSIKDYTWVSGFYFNVIQEDGSRKHYILEFPKMTVSNIKTGGYMVEIRPDVLEHFFGLFDKKGNKIFTGDVVLTDNGEVGIVKFIKSEMAYGLVNPKTQVSLSTRRINNIHTNAVEVIGDIHQGSKTIRRVENDNEQTR